MTALIMTISVLLPVSSHRFSASAAVPKEKAPSTLVQKSFSWILDAMYTTDPSTPPVSAAAMQSAALPLSTTPKKKEINI